MVGSSPEGVDAPPKGIGRIGALISQLEASDEAGCINYQKSFIIVFHQEPKFRRLTSIELISAALARESGYQFQVVGMRRACFEIFFIMSDFNFSDARLARERLRKSRYLLEKLRKFEVMRASFFGWTVKLG